MFFEQQKKNQKKILGQIDRTSAEVHGGAP
jgi:hypothetical protein